MKYRNSTICNLHLLKKKFRKWADEKLYNDLSLYSFAEKKNFSKVNPMHNSH